jgi:hypothetical protein
MKRLSNSSQFCLPTRWYIYSTNCLCILQRLCQPPTLRIKQPTLMGCTRKKHPYLISGPMFTTWHSRSTILHSFWSLTRSKTRVYGRSLAGIAGSNPAGSMNVSCDCCVLLQVQASSTGRSLVQGSLTECERIIVWDPEMRRPTP